MNALPVIILAAALGGCVHNPEHGGEVYYNPRAMNMISQGINTLAGPQVRYIQQPAPMAPMFQSYQVRPTHSGGAFPGHYTVTRY